MKTFYNGRKISIIPPLLINDKLETDFKKKTHNLNLFFAFKCTPLINNSVLPDSVDYISTARLSSINVNNVDKLKIIKYPNVNKAPGHDDISIRMIKLCDQSIVKPLSIIFKNYINNGIFPDIWKKSNIIPVHKKGDKKFIDNVRPVSLLPICSKIFVKLLFNSTFKFPDDNNLLSSNQSDFRPSDFCEYQLLSIVHDIYASFDSLTKKINQCLTNINQCLTDISRF